MNVIIGFVIIFGFLVGAPDFALAAENKVIAVNIALVPDAAMTAVAKTVNARLLKSFPQGFALDDTHEPHITLLQRYIRAESLNAVLTAIDKVLANLPVTGWRLVATKYHFNPWADRFLGSVTLAQNDDLLTLQQQLIEAIAPYTEKKGMGGSFFKTQAEPDISGVTIDYVANFVPASAGKNYSPHLTIGFASAKLKQDMLAEPFKTFSFTPSAIAIYQIGNYGTARKKLKEWR